jgi:hypothetical protein
MREMYGYLAMKTRVPEIAKELLRGNLLWLSIEQINLYSQAWSHG